MPQHFPIRRRCLVLICNRERKGEQMRPFYHQYPDTFQMVASVVESRPGRVRLDRSPFYPGGGGQPGDKGQLRWSGQEAKTSGFAYDDGASWVLLNDAATVEASSVEAIVNAEFRTMMRELHTATHILNALIFRRFDGALVTGAQLSGDGTARLDFDLPLADNDQLRSLEEPINDVILSDLRVIESYVSREEADRHPGLIRSKSVAPPTTEDGQVRIIEIQDLDRQACGGTHVASTSDIRPVRILKVENKGRHNRRIRIGFSEYL